MLLTFLFAIAFFISTSICDDPNGDGSKASTEALFGSGEGPHLGESDEIDLGSNTPSPTNSDEDEKPRKPLERQNAIRRRHKKNKKSQEEELLEPTRRPSRKEKAKLLFQKAADKAKLGAKATAEFAKKAGKAAGKKAKHVAEKAKEKYEDRKKRREEKQKLMEE
ncbi:hypothetical protein M513_05948 [Trichuris suis]|uniref:Uncharacterized protein n=1 Tax=Trichuris suis TaxID=68888 RepID=A0A085M7P2_9BILA|nr:hypothetical protein M513_05948 [Trichuris suis]